MSCSHAGFFSLTAATVVDFALIAEIFSLILLIIASAFISGSEVAYFSLTPNDLEDLMHRKGKRPATALHLLSKPDRLLGTILVANNTLNIAIIILAAFISSRVFDLGNNPVLSFIIEVVVITFILLLFCEVMPKVYASKNQLRFTLVIDPSLALATRVFKPVAKLLSAS